MQSITIKFRDGSVREFPHQGRAGGSYSKRVRYEGQFVIVTDEWHNETAFPVETVAEVYEKNERPGW